MPRPGWAPPVPLSSYQAVFFDFAGTLFSDRALRDVHLDQLRFVAEAINVQGLTDGELRAAYRQGMSVGFRTVAAFPCYLHRDLFGAAFVHMAKALGGELDAATANEAVDRPAPRHRRQRGLAPGVSGDDGGSARPGTARRNRVQYR